jgi:hypothetical protein
MKRSTSSRSRDGKGVSHSQRPASSTHSTDKKKKGASHTQGDIPENIDEILFEISLKKPRRAYNFYINEMKEKEKNLNLIDTVVKYAKKWPSVSGADKKRYQEMEHRDIERYNNHLELVKRHILQKPLKETATAYRIYLDEHIRKAIENNQDPKEAKVEAAEAWKNMKIEDRREYNEKKKAHLEFYENLRKANSTISGYTLYCRDQMAAARDEDKTMTLVECAEAWKKCKTSVKEKYSQLAEDENAERAKNRDMYEIAFGVKPRRPHGAYKFFLMEAAKQGKLGSNALSEGIKLWKKLPESDKERYHRMAQRDKLAYLVKKMEYDQTLKKNNLNKRALTPLNLFMQDMKGKVDTKDIGRGGYFEYCYKKWNKMEDAAKKKYFKMADEQKANLDSSRKEDERVFDQPKRPGNAYTIYLADAIKELKEKHPKKETTELFAIVAENWKKMSEKDKKPFTKLAEKHMEEYRSQLNHFNENGFYTTSTQKSSQKRKSSKKRSQSSESRGKKGKKTTSKE